MCPRAKKIIPGLLKKINKYENVGEEWEFEDSMDNGQYSGLNVSTDESRLNLSTEDLMAVMHSESKKIKLLLCVVVFFLCLLLFK